MNFRTKTFCKTVFFTTVLFGSALVNAQDKIQVLIPAHLPAPKLHGLIRSALNSEFPNLEVETLSTSPLDQNTFSDAAVDAPQKILTLGDVPNQDVLNKPFHAISETSRHRLRDALFPAQLTTLQKGDLFVKILDALPLVGKITRIDFLKLIRSEKLYEADYVLHSCAGMFSLFDQRGYTLKQFIQATEMADSVASTRLIEILLKGIDLRKI